MTQKPAQALAQVTLQKPLIVGDDVLGGGPDFKPPRFGPNNTKLPESLPPIPAPYVGK